MIFLYVAFIVYIFAVNFYGFRLLKDQRDGYEAGEYKYKGDGKIILAALLGGAISVYVSMFILRFRLSSFLLMVAMPLFAVLNFYCFFLGFRGIYFL